MDETIKDEKKKLHKNCNTHGFFSLKYLVQTVSKKAKRKKKLIMKKYQNFNTKYKRVLILLKAI